MKNVGRSTLNSPLTSITEDESGIRESFEFSTFQGATSLMVESKIAKGKVTDAALLSQIFSLTEQWRRLELWSTSY